MLREYWKRPDATLEAFRNLWFHTGDRARADADGFIYYVDRVTDSIRRRGENISSFELESVVGAHPGVAECAAYGVPSELGEEEVMVAIVADPAGLDRDDFFAYCEARVSTFAVPRYLRIVSRAPEELQPACAEVPPPRGGRHRRHLRSLSMSGASPVGLSFAGRERPRT